jgi:cellulose synthase/poly-beta-1,6-N-acetylglucosamine synthase-like glycosyltransferase
MIKLIHLVIIFLIILYPFFEIVRIRSKKTNIQDYTLKKAVSVIMIVSNEERNVDRKIKEILVEPIWLPGSEFIIVSAGSTDQTNSILHSHLHDLRIKVFIFEENNSKIESLNFAISRAKNEFLVFSDCRQIMVKNSIFNLLKKLELEQVDIVNSTLINVNTPKNSIRNYINLMNLRKSLDSNAMNIYGALYAQRKSTTSVIPSNIIFDDLYVLASALSRNLKIKQADDAIIQDAKFVNYYAEERIQRLTRGLLLFFFRHFELLRKMSLCNKYHFIMSKYSKLLIPILFLLLVLNITINSIFQNNDVLISNSIVFVIILFAAIFNKNLKRSFQLIFYTLRAQYLYFFKNARSVRWKKFSDY